MGIKQLACQLFPWGRALRAGLIALDRCAGSGFKPSCTINVPALPGVATGADTQAGNRTDAWFARHGICLSRRIRSLDCVLGAGRVEAQGECGCGYFQYSVTCGEKMCWSWVAAALLCARCCCCLMPTPGFPWERWPCAAIWRCWSSGAECCIGRAPIIVAGWPGNAWLLPPPAIGGPMRVLRRTQRHLICG